ncbi:MAG: hypothetical protein V1646_04080 [bacterium]
MKKLLVNVFFVLSLFFTGLYFTLYSTSQDGTSTPRYQLSNNVFYDREFARGFVRLANGFTVEKKASGVGSTHGSCVFMDTCTSVSGAIDLRETNTIFLQSDLILDNGVTFSSGGNISGYDRALILNGDLTIPDGKIIHTGGRIVIDGNGHKLILGNSAQLFVDTDATLTLRNLVLQNTRNQPGHPAVQCAASGSKLCLDDVELALADDFYFNRGQFFIHNDVAVTGTSSFVYCSTNPSHITAASVFYFNPATTLDFRPSTTGIPQFLAKDLLFMQDATSQLYLNGCTLKTTMTGLRLTKGQLIFDNKVTMTSAAQLQLKSTGTWVCTDYGSYAKAVNWSPDGRYLAVGGSEPTDVNKEIQIYSFNGASLILVASENYGNEVFSVNWSPDGRYLAVVGYILSGNAIQIYSFNGSTLTLVVSQDYGINSVNSVNWSPDGRYIAVGGVDSISGNEIQVYSFNGSSLSLVASRDYGVNVYSVNWSPDGRYLAVGGHAPTAVNKEIQVYSFNGSSLTLVAFQVYGESVYSINWSPDGRYLAALGYIPSGSKIQVYSFNGASLTLVVSQDYGNFASSVNWSPDGRYLAIGSASIATQLQVYSFYGSSLTLVASQDYGNFASSVNWSPDARYLAVGGQTSDSGHNEIEVYILQYGPETQIQALSNSIVFGNSDLGSSYDLNVRVLAGAQVTVDGLLNCDNVN